MQYIKEAIRENKFFLIPFILVLIITAPVLAGQDKLEVHLFLNRYHSNFGDGFFRSVTKLGDGSIPFILGAILALFPTWIWLYLRTAHRAMWRSA